jgi:hypothetical protein
LSLKVFPAVEIDRVNATIKGFCRAISRASPELVNFPFNIAKSESAQGHLANQVEVLRMWLR